MSAFSVVLADPPWPLKWNGGGTYRKNGRGQTYMTGTIHRRLPYSTMPVDEIAALNVRALAADNSALFLWAPDLFILDGSASRVAAAWGFAGKRFIVWAKRGYGMGTFPRPQHELILFATRGNTRPRRRDVGSVHSWKFVYERAGRTAARRHSAKPAELHALIEAVYPGPYLELFARSARLGWTTFGNECPSSPEIRDVLEARRSCAPAVPPAAEGVE